MSDNRITPDHVMIDLETMGTTPESAIVSIGAVMFDPRTGKVGKAETKYSFYAELDWDFQNRFIRSNGGRNRVNQPVKPYMVLTTSVMSLKVLLSGSLRMRKFGVTVQSLISLYLNMLIVSLIYLSHGSSTIYVIAVRYEICTKQRLVLGRKMLELVLITLYMMRFIRHNTSVVCIKSF